MNGIGNDKPVKCFARVERVQVQFKCSHCKFAWNMILQLVRAGKTSKGAINLMQAAYGPNKSVTDIIDGLKKDKKQHPAPHAYSVSVSP